MMRTAPATQLNAFVEIPVVSASTDGGNRFSHFGFFFAFTGVWDLFREEDEITGVVGDVVGEVDGNQDGASARMLAMGHKAKMATE